MKFITSTVFLFLFAAISNALDCDPLVSKILGQRYRFESKNFQGHFFRHRGFQMWKDPDQANNGLFQLDSTFDIVPGLAGVGISFRSVNYPNHYIRHSGFKCFIHRSDGRKIFREDATFIPRIGLSHGGGLSFESLNYPGRFIRHRSHRVQIDQIDGTQLFRDDATWFPHCTKSYSVHTTSNLISSVENSYEGGLEVGQSETTSYGINTQSPWKAAVANGNYECIFETLFKRKSHALKKAGISSFSPSSTFSNGKSKRYQLVGYLTTSEGTLIISKTNLFRRQALANIESQDSKNTKGDDATDINDTSQDLKGEEGDEIEIKKMDHLYTQKGDAKYDNVADEDELDKTVVAES